MVKPHAQSILPLTLRDAVVRKQGTTILHGITADFDPDDFTIVMGPNGSGKTTLLRLMHGLERPRSGAVSWSIADAEARTRQAFVFQTPVMMRRSAIDNIAYALTLRGLSKTEAREQSMVWLEDVGLAANRDLPAHFLSGGERQKLAIARALAGKPDVLFLDEPTTNLDGRSTREIETILLTAHNSGTKIIMTTHDVGQAKRLADDVLFLNKGTTCERAAATAFFNRPETQQARAYLRGDIVE